jgi:hypothetical protein
MAPNDHDDDPVQSEESDSSDADDLTEDELLALQGIKYETDTGGHRLGLYVAALFQKLEGHPDAYKDFFDPAIKSFKFLRFSKEKSGHLSMMIWRKGNIVVVCCSATSSLWN